MSVLKATSWGRTRRPKSATGNDGHLITGSVSLAKLNQLPTASFNATNGCYRTENQRYAHISCSGSTSVTNLYAYN